GGYITVKSEFGSGSQFTLWIPNEKVKKIDELVLEHDDVSKLEVEAIDMETSAKRILIIDDDPTMHSLMRRYLNHKDWHPIFASNGQEGLERAREYKPDVITLDVLMPGMDGWSVMRALKEDPDLAEI